MKFSLRNTVRAALSASLLLSGWTLAGAQDKNQATTPAPDNTKINQQDPNAAEPPADQQKMNTGDRETTKQIRQAIIKDKSISTYGHNVKVITQNGMVTLKGPVSSEEEQKAIEDKTAEIAGADKITSQLEVKEKQ